MDPALGNVISYQRLQLITCGQHKMGWKIPVILMCCPPPHSSVSWRLGTQREWRPPSGPPASAVVRWVTRTPYQASGPPGEGAAWGRPPARGRRHRCLTSESSASSSSVKLYSSYQKFGLIYIYTNIYITIYLYTVVLLNYKVSCPKVGLSGLLHLVTKRTKRMRRCFGGQK